LNGKTFASENFKQYLDKFHREGWEVL